MALDGPATSKSRGRIFEQGMEFRRNGDWVSCPMLQVVSSFEAIDPKALNLSVSDLYLHRNAILELSAGAPEREQD